MSFDWLPRNVPIKRITKQMYNQRQAYFNGISEAAEDVIRTVEKNINYVNQVMSAALVSNHSSVNQ